MQIDQQQVEQLPFGWVRRLFFPIHQHELKRLLPLFGLYFLIALVYHVLRCLKITLLVNAENSGVFVLPYVKFWVILPTAFLFTYWYTKLNARFEAVRFFKMALIFFFVFFFIFTLIMYPYGSALSPSTTTAWLQSCLPAALQEGLQGFLSLFEYWHLVSYYAMSEMWSSMMLSILFWGLTNEITALSQAKRFYAFIAVGANLASILSGELIQWFTLKAPLSVFSQGPYGQTAWDQTFLILMLFVLLSIVAIFLLLSWYKTNVLDTDATTGPFNNKLKNSTPSEIESPSISFWAALKMLSYNRYIRYLALIVFSYNMIYHFADILWTHQLQIRFPNPADMNAFIARMDVFTGALSMIGSILIFSNMLRILGWTKTALTSPYLWLFTTLPLFAFLILENRESFQMVDLIWGLPLNQIILLLGVSQICLGRACKFTIFDQAKEMAYIPLNLSEKRAGKAIIDGLMSRLGKSGSAFILQVLFLITGSQLDPLIPLLSIFMLVLIALWVFATKQVGQVLDQNLVESPSSPCRDLLPQGGEGFYSDIPLKK